MEKISLGIGLLLILMGLWGTLTQKNLIKIIIGFTLFDTGLHVVMVSIAYIKGRTAPILDNIIDGNNASEKIVDPLPQALVLTAIVIGLGVTALMLAYVLKMYQKSKALDIAEYKSLMG